MSGPNLDSDHEIIDVAKQPNEREFMMKHGIKNKGKLFQYESQEVKNIYIYSMIFFKRDKR